MFSFDFDFGGPKVEEQEAEYEYKETEIEKALVNIDLDKLLDLDQQTPDEMNFYSDDILGNESMIFQILKDSIHLSNDLMNNVEKDLVEIDYRIEYYKSYIFEDGKRESKIKNNNFLLRKGSNNILSLLDESLSPSPNYLSEAEIEEKIKNNEMYYPTLKSEKKSSSSIKKTMDNFNYIGFMDHELTELPNNVEAPQLLNKLSNKMAFKKSFLKYWSVIIRTEASIAILLDGFWWFYLTYFKKDPTLEIEAYKFFCRISESFAGLLLNIHPSIRDRFFGNYANFLSQAIYLAFFNAFPDSYLQLNDTFKEELCNTVHEWILGLRPIPESYLNWQINDEIQIIGDQKVSSNNEILSKISNLEKLLNSLGEKDSTVKFSEEKDLHKQETKSSSDFNKIVDSLYKKNNYESHVVGEGSIIEIISFNLKGKSTLINHYLNLHNLNSDSSVGFKMTRSEIVKNPPKTAPTYRDTIYDTLQRAKTLDDAYKKTTEESQNEIKKLEKERKKAVAEFLRIKRSSSAGKELISSSKSLMKLKSNSSASIKMDLDETDEYD